MSAGRAQLVVCPPGDALLKLLSAPNGGVRTTCSSSVMATQSILFSEGGSAVSLPNLPDLLPSFSHCRADSLSGARGRSGYC